MFRVGSVHVRFVLNKLDTFFSEYFGFTLSVSFLSVPYSTSYFRRRSGRRLITFKQSNFLRISGNTGKKNTFTFSFEMLNFAI